MGEGEFRVGVQTQNSGHLSREWPQVELASARQASGEHGFMDQKEPENTISSLTLASGAFAPSASNRVVSKGNRVASIGVQQ